MDDSATVPQASRRARWHLLALSVVTLIASHRIGAQTTSSSETLDRFAGVGFPSAVGAFSAVRADRYADPSLGISVRYGATGTRAIVTLYVYPSRATLDEEFASAMTSITMNAAQSGGRITATIDSTDTLVVKGIEGRYALVQSTVDGNAERSLLYLFERDGHWIKLRISMDPALRVTLAEPLQSLIARMVESVEAPPAGR
jgi:hypothetical protein